MLRTLPFCACGTKSVSCELQRAFGAIKCFFKHFNGAQYEPRPSAQGQSTVPASPRLRERCFALRDALMNGHMLLFFWQIATIPQHMIRSDRTPACPCTKRFSVVYGNSALNIFFAASCYINHNCKQAKNQGDDNSIREHKIPSFFYCAYNTELYPETGHLGGKTVGKSLQVCRILLVVDDPQSCPLGTTNLLYIEMRKTL